MDGAGIHAKGTGRNVTGFERLRVDQEQPGCRVAHEHAFPGAEEGAGVDAHPIAETEASGGGDPSPHQGNLDPIRIEDRAQRADLLGRRCRQEDPVDADFHGLEDEFGLRGIVDLDHEPRLAPLEVGDQIFERDDFPILRLDDEVPRLPAHPTNG